MGKVNLSRVILGGILAGIVVNLSEWALNDLVMKEQNLAAMQALGKTMPMGTNVMVVWLLWGFAFGIAGVWLYAAIRPRYGAGPSTAVRAGLAAWFFSCLLSTVAMWNMGLFPFSALAFVWVLVQDVVAILVGAAVYKEAQG